MANRNDQGDHDSERMGRGVKEGLNAGQSRNAHDSGSRGASGAGSSSAGSSSAGSSGMQGASSDRGRGGYGDDSGFTGGSRASREDADEESHNSPRAAAPGSEGANVEDHSRIDGVGHQAPSGMEERESSGETR